MGGGRSLRIAAVQMDIGKNLFKNLQKATGLIERGANAGAALVMLPETLTCPLGNAHYLRVAEPIARNAFDRFDGSGSAMLASAALANKVYTMGGVIEAAAGAGGGKPYNTIVAYSPEGELVAKYRKIQLSKMSFGGDATSMADVLQAGSDLATFDVPIRGGGTHNNGGEGRPFCRVGMAICFEIRFQELSRLYRVKRGVDLMAYPSMFLHGTGEFHWELMLRGRALDNQVFVAAPAHSFNDEDAVKLYGHSLICDSWGTVLAESGSGRGDHVVVADLDFDHLDEVRKNIPLSAVRRDTVYRAIEDRP